MAIQLVLFDAAGTLLVKPGLARAFVDAIGPRAGIDEATVARRHKIVSEVTDFPDHTDRTFYDTFNGNVLRALGIPADGSITSAIYDSCRSLSWQPAPGSDTLRELRTDLGVISNWGHGLEKSLEPLGLPLRVVVASADVRLRKPDPAIFHCALEQAGVVPAEAVYVGDSIRLDIEPARAIGMRSILVDPLDVFSSHPGCRVRSLAELGSALSAL